MKPAVRLLLLLSFALVLLAGCGGTSNSVTPGQGASAPLSAANVNLIFVVSDDLAFHANGDMSPTTGNLTAQGLQRTLLMAPFLQQNVLGNANVTGIYALEPMTHLQVSNTYPDMAGLELIQQFAMMNEDVIQIDPGSSSLTTANTFHINASYALGQVVQGLVPPQNVAAPLLTCGGCQGIDFANFNHDNDSLISSIVQSSGPGFYVFSSPWETTQEMLATLNQANGYSLSLPSQYQSPNYIYAMTITPSGSASLVTYNSDVTPPTTYPILNPAPPVTNPCQAALFKYSVPSAHPPVSNTNETLYLIRHAEAHPNDDWDNGNYVAAGQWRALALPGALKGKIDPDEVYSIDPAQVISAGYLDWSYVRPSVTVQPYVIANDLPYKLVSGFELFDVSNVTQNTIDYFFNDPQFSNHKILLAWEHKHFPPLVNGLLKIYGSSQTVPDWGSTDYDSIWKVTLDSAGNLTVDNSLCEGIDSTKLPLTAPQF